MADNLDIFMHAERIQESGDDYTAANSSGHFGAYQFDISTWVYALSLAGVQYVLFAGVIPSLAPPGIQDAAARALMSKYFGEFGNNFHNVAEAWYGGPGAVGHPTWGGGVGFPTVGEYADQVIAIYNCLGGAGGGSTTPAPPSSPYVAATLLQLLLALNQEATQRGIGDAHSREQAAAGIAAEAVGRSLGDAHSREQAAAGILAEATGRSLGDQHSREQAAAAILALEVQLTAQIDSVLKYAQTIPGLIDTRAANGYDPTLRARGGALQKLLDTVVAHDPLAASLVSRLATFIIDLAGVEDPIVRIAAQLILKQVIDRFGIDTALHQMLSDLLGGILGGGQPKTLQAITADVGNRLDALEAGEAALAPLAPEADQLHELGTLAFDVALLGYLAAAVAAPVATANDTVAVLEPVTGPLLSPVRSLLGM